LGGRGDDSRFALFPATNGLHGRDGGFRVERREYSWSGFFGDAIVVSFAKDAFGPKGGEQKIVFWSELNYAPAWQLNPRLLFSYQFIELWRRSGALQRPGCAEAMSDDLLFNNYVKILEDNAVRKVIHWHHLLLTPAYRSFHEGSERWPESDEFWTIYSGASLKIVEAKIIDYLYAGICSGVARAGNCARGACTNHLVPQSGPPGEARRIDRQALVRASDGRARLVSRAFS
jgi:hypothetical protein